MATAPPRNPHADTIARLKPVERLPLEASNAPIQFHGKGHRKTLARWAILALLAIAAAASAYFYFTQPAEVPVTRPTVGAAVNVVYGTGFIEPQSPVEISSRVTAPVLRVLVDEGDRVSAGQPVAILDSADARTVITQLAAERVNAQQDESRVMTLFNQGFTTRTARDKAVATTASTSAAEAAARARLNQYTIRSGISGAVLRRDVEPGDLASPTKTLFQIGNPALLRITAIVDERDIPLVRKGARVLMSTDAYPGRVIRGSVADITPGGDPDQRAFRVRIHPDSTRDLPIGLTLEVNIVASEKSNALLVPAGAVRGDSVWTVSDSHARKVKVSTGIRGADRTEVTGGLSKDACVITAGFDDIKDGQSVKTTGC